MTRKRRIKRFLRDIRSMSFGTSEGQVITSGGKFLQDNGMKKYFISSMEASMIELLIALIFSTKDIGFHFAMIT
jgi:hypothetical protein